jgi:pimeloyl-ACP methyl ester carboxylesterase
MLPGAQGSGDIHFRLALRLAHRGIRTLAVTPPADSDDERLADGLGRLLDVLGLPLVHLYGSSIGGYLAQVFAHRHPNRVCMLFIANSFCDPTVSQAKYPPVSTIEAEPADTRLRATRDRITKMEGADPAQAELQQALIAIVGPHQSAEELKARILCLLKAKPIGTVPLAPARVVLIDSDDDPTISAKQREQIRRAYANSPHYEIAGGGHYPSVLRPDSLAEAVAFEMSRVTAEVSGLAHKTSKEKETKHEVD